MAHKQPVLVSKQLEMVDNQLALGHDQPAMVNKQLVVVNNQKSATSKQQLKQLLQVWHGVVT